MAGEILDLFQRGLAAWNEGDVEGIVAMCHPDVEWTFSDRLPDATGQIRGRAAVKDFLTRFTEDWSEISIAADRIIEAGDNVVAEVRFVAQGRDGIEVSMQFVHVWTGARGPGRALSRLPDARPGLGGGQRLASDANALWPGTFGPASLSHDHHREGRRRLRGHSWAGGGAQLDEPTR